ncbi:hypothetical protein BaRGS_00004748, partial [Batillaria attramentaria]
AGQVLGKSGASPCPNAGRAANTAGIWPDPLIADMLAMTSKDKPKRRNAGEDILAILGDAEQRPSSKCLSEAILIEEAACPGNAFDYAHSQYIPSQFAAEYFLMKNTQRRFSEKGLERGDPALSGAAMFAALTGGLDGATCDFPEVISAGKRM